MRIDGPTISTDPEAPLRRLLRQLAARDAVGRPVPCRVDPEPFTSENYRQRAEAAQACGACPLLNPCREYAQAQDERWHVWAGVDRRPRPTKRSKPGADRQDERDTP